MAALCSAISVTAIFAACAGSEQELRATPGGAIPPARTHATERIIYSFGATPSLSDGIYPDAGLIYSGGTLYGTATQGGYVGSACAHGCGVVFTIDPASGTERVIHSFTGPDGANPQAPLVNVHGTLYGTTASGGSYNGGGFSGGGTVFSVTKSGEQVVLHSFAYEPDGNYPIGSLTDVKGTLYGTTEYGGANDLGTVFKITRSGEESVLYSFKGASYGDGEAPYAGLINVNGELYGTTSYGGAACGTVFKISLSGKEKVLYRFEPYNNDGCNLEAGLVELGGILYGTTRFGGKYADGTVFSITTSGKEQILHSFEGEDGSVPESNLIVVNGKLYGTTFNGGASGQGTVFSIEPSGRERAIYSFGPLPDGAIPQAGLIDVSGTLYGTTTYGGANTTNCENKGGCGTVFSISLSQ